MKISIVVYDTRGGVQPMLALADGLIKRGHEVLFCANPENEKLVTSYNCPFRPFGPNVREQMKINAAAKKSPDSFSSAKGLKKEIEKQIEFLPKIIQGSDLVLASGIVFGVRSAAEIAKVPFRLVIFYPSALGPGNTGSFLERLKFNMGMSMLNKLLKGTINKKRKEGGISPINNVVKYFGGDNIIVASDVVLNKVRDGVKATYTQTGYMFLSPLQELSKDVEDFITAGKPPVFISFGSNPISNPGKLTDIFEEVSKKTNQRLIISKGWAELATINSSPNVLYVDDVPFDLLFPKMTAIIHHGGSGTMAYAAKAGVAQAAFPYMFDQFENRKTIVKLGLGPHSCDFKKISVSALIAAINDCVNNKRYKENALEIAQKLQDSKGLEKTIALIEKI
ncbi:glycosyltransferase family 1 protein [Panacibacter ginsenosidivorans]|uniref:Glycosyltransferase family 1 protein n=1 Tax=Panacibacter ginsenosidivorans TaxID=1813871 RepID=A0A5B8VDC7_9BACT|nr:glycosyltransferase [Panacibacter ginsenosidivorans]QEC68971.1 glycosyltransferase family 1 protein [Panacibacter ginsenosidivorans]